MYCQSNNIHKALQGTCIVSATFSDGHGIEVFPENFRRTTALFCARKTIKGNWINDKDEYQKPNTDHPSYEQWVNDAIVYSLFNPSSQQSSLRDIEYEGETWDIENEFFWMSHQEIQQLADEEGFVGLFNDTQQFPEDRYVYEQLENLTLSEDAQELLDTSKELVRKSMSLRERAAREKPEMHLRAWDAGWYQIRKGILEEYFEGEYENFVESYKEFEERMREGVYEFSFLKG